MDSEAIAAVLDEALPFRPPRFEPGTGGAAKTREIEDFMLKAALLHAELEEAHHWLSAVVERSTAQVAEITGFEAALPRKPRDRVTRDDVIAAKRVVCPEPFLAGAEAKRLRATVLRQIDRLKTEHDMLSRAYSLISGS